jgi:tRNA pseudouridine55 synthase
MGYQELVPPVHSAVKIGGKRAYSLARKGEEVILPPRPIYISRFEVHTENFPVIGFEVSCTKGTYIRSIAHEFGQRLGNSAYLSSLRRTRIGDFSAEQAWSPDELVKKLLPPDSPLSA